MEILFQSMTNSKLNTCKLKSIQIYLSMNILRQIITKSILFKIFSKSLFFIFLVVNVSIFIHKLEFTEDKIKCT